MVGSKNASAIEDMVGVCTDLRYAAINVAESQS